MNQQTDPVPAAKIDPIAIIGMSCRLPGADDPDALWQLTVSGIEGVREYPGGRTRELDAFYGKVGKPDGPASLRGGFLPGIDRFDAAFFEISPREAEWLDPQQRLLLELGWEALEDAGIPLEALARVKAGAFVGVWTNEYERHAAASAPVAEFFLVTGGPLCGTSSRMAFQFDLRGPDFSVNAACASSLVAVHLAVRSLRSGECSVALAGGANVLVRPETTQAFSRSKMLSPDGRCKFGDAGADGFVRSDGAGMLVLKRLADAQRDGDRILGLIRGTAMASDGRGSGLLATPSAAGQRQAMVGALADAGCGARSVDYVEAHGTGTRVGDPIEISAIASVFGRPAGSRPEGAEACRIGSVKSIVGHTESAAGVTSIIRTVMALRHRRYPATLHVSQPTPSIDWQTAGVMLEREGADWPKPQHTMQDAPRRAAVNGLGLTGTNVHVILEEAPDTEPKTAEPRGAYLLPLSAATGAALAQRAQDMARALSALELRGAGQDELSDFCYTAAVRRSHLAHRLAVTGTGITQLRERLEEFAAVPDQAPDSAGQTRRDQARRDQIPYGRIRFGSRPKIAFVFPGQGSQWVGMGRELLKSNAAFGRSMAEIDRAIQEETGWSVVEQLQNPAREERLARIDIVQPTLFAVEVALAETWQSWGVLPEAVVGHSMGEIAAACVAGILSLEDAVKIICRRSVLLTRVAGAGAMVVVDLPRAEAETLIAGQEDRISIAVSNSPRSTVLAGDPAALEAIVASLEQRDVFCRWVRVDVASHSPQMDPLLPDLRAALAKVRPHSGSLPMCSTVNVGMVDPLRLDGGYWVDNLRRPVLFASAVQELLKQGFNTFIEMSAHPLLAPFVEQTAQLGKQDVLALGSLRRDEPETETLLASLGRLYAAGGDVAWQRLYPVGNLVQLPAYPWQRERFWMESSAHPLALSGSETGHPLLGEPLRTATGGAIWSATLTAAAHPWLKDHAVGGTVLLPASAFIEVAAAAAEFLIGEAAAVENLVLTGAAPLLPENPLHWQVVAERDFQDAFTLRFFLREPDAGAWVQTAQCALLPATPREWPKAGLTQWDDAEFSSRAIGGKAHDGAMAALGYGFGPAFRRMEWLALEGEYAVARITLPEELTGERYLLHPAVLDAALQLMGRLLIENSPVRQTLLPTGCARVVFTHLPVSGGTLLVRARAHGGGMGGDAEILDAEGRLIVELRGLSFKALEDARETADAPLYAIRWEKQKATETEDRRTSGGHWLLIGGVSGFAAELVQALERQGASAALVQPADLLRQDSGDKKPDSGVGGASGAVWLTPLELDGNASLAGAQRVLAEGAALAARLADFGDGDSMRMWAVTRGTQAASGEPVSNPLAAGTWGLIASVSNEYPLLKASCIDLPASPIEGEADRLALLLLSARSEARSNAGSEHRCEDRIALRQEGWFAARLDRFGSHTAASPMVAAGKLHAMQSESEGFALRQRTRGSLETLELVSEWSGAPAEDEVEIAVEAAGLNFKDVLRAMDIHEALAGSRFGGECAGRVLRVGKAVQRFQPGDAVLAISGNFQKGMFSSRVKAPAALVMPIPESMSFAEAAGIPCVFLTAWYALVKLARLKKGERVLVHAAAGGVGLAAIQIAQWIGAEIYATVGSDQKRSYLNSLGVEHIMHSRKLDFTREILESTDGKGVDVVLNSLSGPAIPAGLEALANYGRFVEIGRRDILEDSRIGLRPFGKNLSLFAVDLAQAVEDRPAMVGEMFAEVMDLFRRGLMKPPPATVFPVSAAAEAFRWMAGGSHIGKIVLNMKDAAAMVRRDASRLAPGATYLITGGLGGLGLVTAQAFVDRGARHLLLVSRGDPSPHALEAIGRMEASGATVAIRPVDMSDSPAVRALLDETRRTMPPLRGIVHAAGVLDDAVVSHLSLEKFERVMAGKVGGALALEESLNENGNGSDLDFLVYYSSAAGVLGSPGQANYAAANAMLDALAHRQRARGMPAISIDWGTWGEAGLAAKENRGARLTLQGLRELSRAEGAALVMRLLEAAPVQAAAMHLDADRWCGFHPAAAGSGFLARLTGRSAARPGQTNDLGENDFAASLGLLHGDELRGALATWLRQQAAAVLRLDAGRIPVDKTFRSLGLDSLMALELRNRLERTLGLKLSATLVWNYPTVSAMAAHLEGRLAAARRSAEEANEKSARPLATEPFEAPLKPQGRQDQQDQDHPQAVAAGRSPAELLELELMELELLELDLPGARSLLEHQGRP